MRLMLDQRHQHEYGHTEPHLQSAILMSSMHEILHLHCLTMIYVQTSVQFLQIRYQIDSNLAALRFVLHLNEYEALRMEDKQHLLHHQESHLNN